MYLRRQPRTTNCRRRSFECPANAFFYCTIKNMADIGVSPSELETLVPGLQYGLQQMSSMITSRREVVVHAQPGTYEPATSRLIRIHVADGSLWWQMATTKLVFDIVNPGAQLLELLVPPLGLFEQFRLLSQGTVLELIESYSRTATTYNALLPW